MLTKDEVETYDRVLEAWKFLGNLVKKKKSIMVKMEDVVVRKKVLYYPYIGSGKPEPAVIIGGPYKICGTVCCMIDIRSSVVALNNLTERKD